MALLDLDVGASARTDAAQLMRTHAEKETALATAAEAEQRVASAYLHRALADDYLFTMRTPDVQKKSREAIDNIAGFWWMMDGTPSCVPLADGTKKFIFERKVFGQLSKLRWIVTKCDIEPEVRTSQIEKKYRRLVKGGYVAGTKVEGTTTNIEVRDRDGTLVSSRSEKGADSYTPGGTTADSYEDAVGMARVTQTKHRWSIEAHVIAEAPGEPAAEDSFSLSKEYDVEQWQILGASQGDQDTSGGSGTEGLAAARESVISQVQGAVFGVTQRIASQRAKIFADKAAAASTPEIAEENYTLSVRAVGEAYPPAMGFLETRLGLPADEIVALITNGITTAPESPLAFRLAVPEPALDPEAQRGTEDRMRATYARSRDGDGIAEISASLQSGASSTNSAGSGDGGSSYGLGLGLTKGVTVDPGVDQSGFLFDLGMDLRFGYTGAFNYDIGVPVALGRRMSNRVGVALLGALGINKFGDTGDELFLNPAGYYGYGLAVSYLTQGSYDVAASYLSVGRSRTLSEYEATISDEDRFEVRVLKHMGIEDALSLTARYILLSGDPQSGRMFTLSVGMVRH